MLFKRSDAEELLCSFTVQISVSLYSNTVTAVIAMYQTTKGIHSEEHIYNCISPPVHLKPSQLFKTTDFSVTKYNYEKGSK
jgi:hypothetical protein